MTSGHFSSLTGTDIVLRALSFMVHKNVGLLEVLTIFVHIFLQYEVRGQVYKQTLSVFYFN